jgi:amyloid beta precursor protein binding protein 1
MASDDKYDRQTRLWGGHGQKKLAHSHVILLGSSSMGSESLKNLALPGLGKFTIVDDAKVTERDFGNEFLVTRDDLGKAKAEVLAYMLTEMNPDVKGEHVNMSPQEFIEKHADKLEACNLIMCCDATQADSVKLGQICDKNNISLMVLRQYGMLASLRVYKQEQTIIEKKS